MYHVSIAGCIGEILGCVVVGNVSIVFLFTKFYVIWIFCCLRFLVPFRVSYVLMNVEFELLLFVLSFKVVLKFSGVVSVVNGATFKYSLCTDILAIAALEISFEILKNKT